MTRTARPNKPKRKPQVIRPDPAAIRYLKKRRRRRIIAVSVLCLLVVSAVVARRPIVGPVGDDWSRFDHKSFNASSIDGSAICLSDVGRVQIIGICIPTGDEPGAAIAREWFINRLVGKPVTLMITGPQTRAADGSLRVRLYLEGSDDLAMAAVKAGMAYVDRRGDDPFRPGLSNAETDARKHERGLWAGLKFDQQPAWRREWLALKKISK